MDTLKLYAWPQLFPGAFPHQLEDVHPLYFRRPSFIWDTAAQPFRILVFSLAFHPRESPVRPTGQQAIVRASVHGTSSPDLIMPYIMCMPLVQHDMSHLHDRLD